MEQPDTQSEEVPSGEGESEKIEAEEELGKKEETTAEGEIPCGGLC